MNMTENDDKTVDKPFKRLDWKTKNYALSE